VKRARTTADILSEISRLWVERVGHPRIRAAVAATALLACAAMLLARHGTPWTRGGAAVVLAAIAAGWLTFLRRERATWRDPARTIRKLAHRVDAVRAERAIRALALVSGSVPEGTSEALARLHVHRTLEALPRDRIIDRAAILGARFGYASLTFAAAVALLSAFKGWSVVEGADVLVAAHQEGPLPMLWLEPVEIEARPPDYLHENVRVLGSKMPMALPCGTLLTVRGVPTHPGRRLTLSDGTSDVPFVDDGAGHAVARWPLATTVDLRVVARFGDVRIPEADVTPVTSLADEVPVVELEGAPREIRVADALSLGPISLRYEATDDHGLREIHLVLRSGAREERRILARLDGETQSSRGGHVIAANDPFIKRSHAPVEIRVEAKDNDPISGPKWGASAAIIVIPPEEGEPEALRIAALRKLRDALVDALSGEIDRVFAVAMNERLRLTAIDGHVVDDAGRSVEELAKASFAGVTVNARVIALLRGQMRRVREAMTREARSPGVASHAELVRATEKLVLVTDAVGRGLAQRDARRVARELGDVADDLTMGLSQMQRSAEKERGELRVSGSVMVLEGGAKSLHQLGSLGRDIGEIIPNDLGRVARARREADLVHAEIAASDLAARLHDPEPSFGARGSSGGRAGGESRGSGSPGGDPNDGDDAQRAFDESAAELDQLAEEHAKQVGKVEQAMAEPESPEETKAMSEQGKAHARAVRDATADLPSVGAGSDSWTNKGAAAREHAETMARALEDGNPSDAVASGRSALDALDEAKRISQREGWTGMVSRADDDPDRTRAERRIDTARQKLEPEVRWAEEKRDAMRKRAAEHKAGELAEDGEAERKVADKVGALHERGQERAMPQDALEALDQAERAASEAASALQRGDVGHGMDRQREAQRQLEMAKRALGSESAEDSRDGDGRMAASGHAEVPTADAHKGPEEFRRRVIAGLGQSTGGRQKEAIRRYADGLLR